MRRGLQVGDRGDTRLCQNLCLGSREVMSQLHHRPDRTTTENSYCSHNQTSRKFLNVHKIKNKKVRRLKFESERQKIHFYKNLHPLTPL